MGRLEGKVALITGGARGQGRAIAAKFAYEGADIVIGDICGQIDSVPYPMSSKTDLAETRKLIESRTKSRVIAEPVDVRDLAQVEDLVKKAVNEFGRIDVLCANAGIVSFGSLTAITEQQWADVLDVNLTGVWKSVKAVVPTMIAQRSGAIILTSSVNGKEAGPDMSHYVAAKHGVLGLLKSFAYELGPYGIRVNAILPGPILSPMADNAATRSWVFRSEDATLSDYIDATRRWHLLRGRPSLPVSAIADAMIWLASGESANVTGVEIPVDAGHMILPGMNLDPVIDDHFEGFDYSGNALTGAEDGA